MYGSYVSIPHLKEYCTLMTKKKFLQLIWAIEKLNKNLKSIINSVKVKLQNSTMKQREITWLLKQLKDQNHIIKEQIIKLEISMNNPVSLIEEWHEIIKNKSWGEKSEF